MKNLILAISLAIISLSGWSSELYTPQAVLHDDNEKLVATVRFNTQETGDLYVAAIVGGKLLFLNQAGGWTETPAPFRANDTFQGEYPLFSVDAGQLPPGNYPLYQVVTVPNGNPLSTDDWIGGMAGLNSLSFSVGLQKQVRVLAFSKAGMHCMDKGFAVFSILPPSNTVKAQVVSTDSEGEPNLLDANQVELRYAAVPDRKGSINSR